MSGEKQHSDGRSDGQFFGQSATDKIGFFGVTPVIKQASVNQTNVVKTTTTTATTTALQTDLDAVRVLALSMRTALINLGFITGAA